MSGSIWRSMPLLAVTAVCALPLPASASTAEVDAQAQIAAKIDVETEKASKAARRSRERAERHLRRARASMREAYRRTQETNARATSGEDVAAAWQATIAFTGTVDANDERLGRLVASSNGRIEALGAKAIAENLELRSRALLSHVEANGRAPERQTSDERPLEQVVSGHAEAFAEVSVLASSKQVGQRARRTLRQGMARALETQAEISARVAELSQRAGEDRQQVEAAGQRVVTETSQMRTSVEESNHAEAPVTTCDHRPMTLGSLSTSVEAQVRADVDDDGASVEAEGKAQSQGQLSLPPIS